MNIENPIRKLMHWFSNRSFIKKMLITYLVCGLIPMLFMMVYYYVNTSNLLRERAYQDIRQDMTVVNNSLNRVFQPFEIMLESFKNDKDLNTLLSLDYTNLSYSDLAYYTRHTLDQFQALYPLVSRIRFFSNNETLPMGYYFFDKEELEDEVLEELAEHSARILASSFFLKRGEKEILLISPMNYYSSNTMRHYITLAIPTNSLQDLFYQDGQNQSSYLIDRQGIVLGSSAEEEIAGNFSAYLSGWEDIPQGEIVEMSGPENQKLLCMKQEMDMGMTLMMVLDEAFIFREARQAPVRMLLVEMLLTLIFWIPAIWYSRTTNRQLQGILEATERIGAGDFDWEVTSDTTDELGQITNAVNHMNHQIDGLIRDNYQKQLELKVSDLNLLQEQINPHFLYNALSVISSMAMREGAKQTIASARYLSEFYRISLNKGRQILSVAEEVELLKSYMKIQMIRFSDILEISYEIAPDIQEYETIKLLLQPLVENAIHHAREEETFLHIVVRGFLKGQRICFEVEDDGIGMEPEILKKLQEELLRQEDGFGLKNVDKRIKLNYGQDYGISVFSEPAKGTRIHLEIPAVRR